MAYCKKCKKEVEPEIHGNKYMCPSCRNSILKVSDKEKKEVQVKEIKLLKEQKQEAEIKEKEELEDLKKEKEELESFKKEKEVREEVQLEGKDKTKSIMAPKTVKYDAADLHMAEILINIGFAKDLNDLARKNMKLAYSLLNMGALGKQVNTMESNETKKQEKEEPDPKRTMKELQEQSMLDAYIAKMERGGLNTEDTTATIDKMMKQQLIQAQINNMNRGGSQSSDPISTMVMLRMMENQGGGKDSKDNGFMDKLLQMQMMQSMSKPQVDAGLQRELTDLKYQMQTQQLLQQNQQAQQGNQSSQDHVMKIEKLRTDHDIEMKKIELETQKQRDINIQFVFDTKLREIQSEMQRVIQEANSQGKKADLSSFKEQFKAVKELNALMGDREKGTGEMIMESLGNVAEKVAPALIELGKARQQQIAHQYIEPQQFPPQQQFQELPEGEIPSTIPHESEMSESEKQMANEMNRMYIQERK